MSISIDNEITLCNSPIENEIEFIAAVGELSVVVASPLYNAGHVCAIVKFNAGPEERLKF